MSENLNQTTEIYPAPAISGNGRKKRKHIFGKMILVLLVLLIAAAGGFLYFHPGVIYAAKSYYALRSYLQQDRYAAAVNAGLQAGSADAGIDTVLVKTTEEDLTVYSLLLDEGPVYFADKGLFLSDGSAFSLASLIPETMTDLGIAEKLMIADRVTKVRSENGSDTYRIGTEGEEALALLEDLFPDLAGRLSSVTDAGLTVTIQDRAVTEAQIDASGFLKEGTPIKIGVTLTDMPADSSYAVPGEILSRIRNAKRMDGLKLLRDMFRFYIAWSRFDAADPRAATVDISAKCGLLNFTTSFDWVSRTEDGGRIDYFIKDGHVVYQTQGDPGDDATAEDQTMVIAVKLFGLAYELCRQDSGGYTEQDGKYIYTAELSEEMMDLILGSVFPAAQRMNITLTSGNVELVLSDYTVDSVSLRIEGSVRVIFFDLPVTVNADLMVADGMDLPL